MSKSKQDIKQNLMKQSAINEIKQTLRSFEAMDAQLNQLAELDLQKIHIQYLHLMQLAEDINDPEFNKIIAKFSDDQLDIKQIYLRKLIRLARKTIIVQQDVISELEQHMSESKQNGDWKESY
ncbi:hypothetical protein [Leuconostoc citreum]|uniref:hypothetical protein n=1 Tax=Leuconostoc citreum TaxID=33964 RepID=UPI0032E04557